MAQNLSWLANQLYPGRKIIVWAHNGHILRNLSPTDFGSRVTYTMSDGVWSEFGAGSYAMAAAGQRFGLVDLRAAVAEDAWLAHPFFARPNDHATDRSQWASNVDAFLFIRAQEPAVAIPRR